MQAYGRAMHIVDALELPDGYTARPYRGVDDLPVMLECLIEHRRHNGEDEMPTLEQITNSYSHLTDCDVEVDLAVFATEDGEPVGYCRAWHDDLDSGIRDCQVFAPIRPVHLTEPVFRAVATGIERHLAERAAEASEARYRADANHPGPGLAPTGTAAWLEALGYTATEWGASLLRPHLDDVPDRPLPDGVEVRAVTTDQIRHIWEVHHEAFRGEWDFHEMTDDEIDEMIDDPVQDHTLWQVAWAGDQVVGQVKPFINHEENARRGYHRGYTEFISTHHDWRNRGIASALLARSLRVLRERGMTEAMLGVDTNNPGGAFQVYTRLGFSVQSYNAVYTKPFTPAR
jgi:mycothiol synthase